MKERYQIVGRGELVTEARIAIDDVIGEVGRKLIETILEVSGQEMAGERTLGKASGEIRWYGKQAGRVMLRDRQMQLTKPRLSRKGAGEVTLPAYEALRQNPETAGRMLGAKLAGVSTRNYKEVLPKMAATAYVSRSAISRQVIEASVEQLRELNERRWDNVELLVIYCDGQRFGDHHIISAVGVDLQGCKHVLGMEPGVTENAAGVKRLFTRLRDNGLKTEQNYLFVIDGAKTLSSAMHEVFGAEQPVQRCRKHKEPNVLAELPKEQHDNARSLLQAAGKSPNADDGIKRVEQLARFYERNHPQATQSLHEGLNEMFTLQRLQIPPVMHKCLATTNLIESPQSWVRRRTLKISRWRVQDMALRWAASAWLATEKHFHKIDGHQQLWALANILGRSPQANAAPQFKVA